jgi:hypothetical protein
MDFLGDSARIRSAAGFSKFLPLNLRRQSTVLTAASKEVFPIRILRRHCLIHSGGVVDEELASKLPELNLAIGTSVPLAIEEFELVARATTKLISANFVNRGGF